MSVDIGTEVRVPDSSAVPVGSTLTMDGPRVLVIEHDADHAKAVLGVLDRMGYVVDLTFDALEGLRHFVAHRPDVVLIDMLLPGLSAIDVCRRIRTASEVPVIMISAVEVPVAVEEALAAGAVDCMAKPDRMRELVARIERARRPVVSPPLPPPSPDVAGSLRRTVTVGSVHVDFTRRRVTRAGEEVHLPRREFDLLAVLLSPPGQLRTRGELVELLWSGKHAEGSRTLDTHVRRLRQKLEGDGDGTRHLVTVRGVGFRFDPEGGDAGDSWY